jgi:hypothetical protein
MKKQARAVSAPVAKLEQKMLAELRHNSRRKPRSIRTPLAKPEIAPELGVEN